MAIRYDPLLIEGLAAEVRRRWQGWRARGAWFNPARRDVRVALRSGDGEDTCLVFLLQPAAGQVLEVPNQWVSPARDGGAWHPFRRLYLSGVSAPADERRLVLELSGGMRDVHRDRPPVYRLVLELHTNQWNAVLARGETGRIESVLWPRTAGGRPLRSGARYRAPEGARDWVDRCPTAVEWLERLAPLEPAERRAELLATAAWTSSINVDWVLGAAAHDPDEVLLEPSLERYRELRREPRGEAWLLDPCSAAQPYPFRLGAAAERCDTLLDAMRISAKRTGVWPSGEGMDRSGSTGSVSVDADVVAEARALDEELRRRIRKVGRRQAALERQLQGDDAGRLRGLADLLLARRTDVPRGTSTVVLDGFDGSPVELELDPRLDAVQNAAELYERARRRERAVAGLPARIREATVRLKELETARAILASEGPSEDLWTIAGGRRPTAQSGPGAGGREPTKALPYRRFRSSGGLEIRVGRSSRENDELTFRHSSPEDIWLHVRQAPGAHVILRWDRRDQQPPRADLIEAAALAAAHSEARLSGLVAVDWTRRKHVRKPRKAPPGTVVPARVRTVFVEPDPEIGKRLSTED